MPTEEVLAEMRAAEPPVHYLVGSSRVRVRQTPSQWEALPWQKIKDSVEVKLFRATGCGGGWARPKPRLGGQHRCWKSTCPVAPGLTPRSVLETLAGVTMLDVEVPTTDDRRPLAGDEPLQSPGAGGRIVVGAVETETAPATPAAAERRKRLRPEHGAEKLDGRPLTVTRRKIEKIRGSRKKSPSSLESWFK